MELLSINVINDLVAFVIGIALNLTLFYIVCRHTPEPMRSYSRMIRVHCLSDCLYGLISFVAAVQVTPLRGTVFLVVSGICSHINVKLASYLLRAYFWAVMFPIALIPIDFYYRYRSVCWQLLTNIIFSNKSLSNKQLFAFVFAAYFLTFLEAFYHGSLFIIVGPTPETQRYTKILRKYAPKWALDVTPAYSVYEPNNLIAVSSVAFVVCLVLFVYVVVIYTVLRINAKVRRDSRVGTNKRIRSTHHQVAKILFVQAAIPMTLCVPTTINSVAALFRFDLPSNFGAYALSMSVWLAVLKPLATIIIVPNYRCVFLCNQNKVVNPTASTFTAANNNPSTIT